MRKSHTTIWSSVVKLYDDYLDDFSKEGLI